MKTPHSIFSNLEELRPRFDCHDSFYRKAYVATIGDDKVLFSYATAVAEIMSGIPKVFDVDQVFSCTTLRHIKEFFKQNGFIAESKSQIKADYYEGGNQ